MADRPIRVLIVDDSALVRQILSELLRTDPGIEVVGTASDAFFARNKIKKLDPDVITLDVEMPRMDGVTFLRNLMRLHPMPVVMVSSLTDRGAEITLDALSLGAVDYLPKPKMDVATRLTEYRDELIEKVRAAARARVRPPRAHAEPPAPRPAARPVTVPGPANSATVIVPRLPPRNVKSMDKLIAVGASTGGTEAIREFLMGMSPDSPGIVIAQHIPKVFSGPFAQRLDRTCPVRVCEAVDGMDIRPGHAYIAPGDQHLMVIRSGGRWTCRLDDGPPVNRHRPSVDVLFRSVAQQAGHNAVGVLLTGMGKDGAQGLKEIQEAGGATLAQDEATSVVWGMPGEAVELGAADEVLPLSRLAARALEMALGGEAARRAV
ncbi:MAG: chemotaxis response regulator protein-glutamate methylesterase [Pseudomonadota bacterium]|jgi:two-component system chemotaxis response regulator CheB|nr:MAG: chemotaxis response regulator protein-glutamate methylesterase [Pseudomonadota bacterium]